LKISKAKLYLLEQLLNAIGTTENVKTIRFNFHIARGRFFFTYALKVYERKDFKDALHLLEYVNEDIELSLKNSQKNDVFQEDDIERLKEDTLFLKCSCESHRLRVQADKLFDIQVNQSEEINFEMIWEILDMYKAAVLHCREIDLENEIIAISRQGRVFDKILKVRDYAHRYYRAAFNMAQCLPRDLNQMDWYRESKEALERFQKDVVKEEEAQKEKERAPYILKLAPVLKELKAVHALSDPYKLLKHVYSKHPPKVKHDYKEKVLNAENVRSYVLKAITQYHPDKQVNYDMEWRVLCEEITKCLTVRYEVLK